MAALSFKASSLSMAAAPILLDRPSRLRGGAALFAKFDGEFSGRSQMYYGGAGMRYSW